MLMCVRMRERARCLKCHISTYDTHSRGSCEFTCTSLDVHSDPITSFSFTNALPYMEGTAPTSENRQEIGSRVTALHTWWWTQVGVIDTLVPEVILRLSILWRDQVTNRLVIIKQTSATVFLHSASGALIFTTSGRFNWNRKFYLVFSHVSAPKKKQALLKKFLIATLYGT